MLRGFLGADREPAGFVAFSAYDADDSYDDGDGSHDGDGGLADDEDEHAGDVRDRYDDRYVARPGGSLNNAQVDRLCVLPERRGRGVKERLLRCADGFHACGVPVRVKTASMSAAKSFVRCALLAYDGFKDPTRAGVSKRRGTKTIVVVDEDPSRPRDDPRRYEDDWRNREVGRSIPVAAETPKTPEEREGEPAGSGGRRGGNVGGDGRSGVSRKVGAILRSDGDRRAAATRAALNRVAPDTVVAVADTIAASLADAFADHAGVRVGDDARAAPPEVSSTADLVAVRGSRDAMFRATYADVAARVALVLASRSTDGVFHRDVFVSAVASAASAPLVRCAAGKGGSDLAGCAGF